MKKLCALYLLFATASAAIAACGGTDEVPPAEDTRDADSGTTPPPTSSGSSSSSGGASGSCVAAGSLLCERACACAGDGKCRIGVETDAGVASVNFETERKCKDLYVTLACVGGGEPGMDYAQCETDLNASACVEAASGKAVKLPPSCKTK